MTWEQTWAELDDGWRRALGLAWESLTEGSIAVGAVVVGSDGRVVAEGRNRSADDDPPRGQLGGSFIAHAEVNALGRLPRDVTAPTTLLTTLEPCALCRAASRHAHVTEVRSAAADPVWAGMERMGELNPFFARGWPDFVDVDLGPLSTWSGALPLVSLVRRAARRRSVRWDVVFGDDAVVKANRRGRPRYVDLAEVLLDGGLAPGGTHAIENVLAQWWPAVTAVHFRRPGSL